MKITHYFTLIIALNLVGCVSATKVDIAKAPDVSSSIQIQKQKMIPDNLPKNVTAVCRDGSYSIAKDDSACLGNGGVEIQINRYYAE